MRARQARQAGLDWRDGTGWFWRVESESERVRLEARGKRLARRQAGEASNCRMRGYARKGWRNDSAPRISGFGIEAPNPKVSMEGNARCRLVGW